MVWFKFIKLDYLSYDFTKNKNFNCLIFIKLIILYKIFPNRKIMRKYFGNANIK